MNPQRSGREINMPNFIWYSVVSIFISASIIYAETRLNNDFIIIILPLVIIVLYLLTANFPEISFALFLTAGVYKADPRLSFLPEFLDLTVVFGILTIMGIFYGVLRNRIKFVIPSLKVLIPYSIIILIGFFSLSYTPAPIYGVDKLLRFSTITLLATFSPFFLFQKSEAFNRFFIMIIILSLSMIFDILSGGLTPGEVGFKSAFGSNYLAVGRICGWGLIVSIFYFMGKTRNKIALVVCLSLIPFLIFGMLISGGRGPLVATLVSFLVVLIFILIRVGKDILSSFHIKKADLRLLTLLFILALVGTVMIVYFSDYFVTLYSRIEVLMEAGGDSALERVNRFSIAFNAMISLPTGISGLGIGGFSTFYAVYDDKRGAYPHNIFLEIGSELGILGLLAFTVFVYWGFVTGISNIKTNQSNTKIFLHITLFALMINMLINSSISGDINDNRLLFTSIGLIYASRKFVK